MKSEKKNKIFRTAIAAMISVALGFSAYLVVKAVMKKTPAQEKTASGEDAGRNSLTPGGQADLMEDNSIFYDGVEYVYNKEIKNILFMGVDKHEFPADGYFDGGQADSIMLICMNTVTKEAEVLQVSRETMVDYEIYNIDNTVWETRHGQLCLQYAYGDGKELSSLATAQRVSEILLDTPIGGYITLDLDAVAMINDLVGGVELTVPEDYTWIDPDFKKGATINLHGSQAERYVRARDTSKSGSNTDRMKRQAQYIPALIEKLRKKIGGDKDKIEEYRELLGDNMITNLQAEDLDELADYNLKDGKLTLVPGDVKEGEEHDEFYVNYDELKKILIKMLYKQK